MRVAKRVPVKINEQGAFTVEVPKGSKLLTIDANNQWMWFEMEVHRDPEMRMFRTYHTDEPIDLDFQFVKSIQVHTRMVHIYEKR